MPTSLQSEEKGELETGPAGGGSTTTGIAPSSGSPSGVVSPTSPSGHLGFAGGVDANGKVPAPGTPEPGTLDTDDSAADAATIWWLREVPRQVAALTRKNLILARRNRTTTLVRTCSSLFFMLLIFLVNEGLKARYSTLAYFQVCRPPAECVDVGALRLHACPRRPR